MTPRPKTGSKPDRDALRHDMAAAGCSRADMVVEMRVRFRLRPREAWRHAHGWTLQGTADRVTELGFRRPGEAVAADASLVGKWEKWPGPSGRRPSLAVLLLLAGVFGCDVEDIVDLADRKALPESEQRILRHSVTALVAAGPQPLPVPPSPPAEAADPSGQDLVRTAADESAAWAQAAEVSNVGDIALEQLMADIRALAADYLTQEPVAVFLRTRRLRDRVFALLEGRQRPRQSADLYVAAGYLCGLLAWISSDLGCLRDAETQGRTAWLCADLSGHNDLQAWVLSTRSKIAFWDGRFGDAINHARRGLAHQPSGTAGVLLACQEADAWSERGSVDEAEAALNRAADVRDTTTGTDDIGGLYSCPEFRRANYAAAIHTRIGNPRLALREAQEALASQPFHAYGTTAQVCISHASTHMALGSLDAACEALGPVLALPPEHRLDTVARRMRELAESLVHAPTADSASARTLRDHIEEFCVESVPRRFALSAREGQD
ncbi:putative transcriptional regulator, XRE family [Streptomyces himastatinicus ATCC 53653]|uniref:Putative transcriptional regulator, XRE family n=1 Tax=Streptomyces himastatinicus ATCC 53653 TaxID=457427 RepID=D9WPP7_9ACTN|nr:putative transcriptional regulator, XRE family [Streptomyces himastatinicus ATCC 53653]